MTDVTDITPICEKACRALWLAVIYQALLDLINESITDHRLSLHGAAYRWFFVRNSGFPSVCRMAGIEPMVMRERARAIRDNPELLRHYHVT